MNTVNVNCAPQFVATPDGSKILPSESGKNILITSALPYVNNVPHLGNIIGCVLSADVFSRYCRQKGWRCLYICGTDEYGTATEARALQEGLTPREICDKYHKIHKSIYEWFNVDFDHFGRTTTEHQTELTQGIFLKLYENGFTVTDTIDQLHCESCKRFLADRFVHGECPYCHYEDARGDQCDSCQKLINAVELIKPKCQICGGSPVVKPSTQIFLKLDQLSGEVEEYINKVLSKPDNHWSPSAISIARSWIKGGLEKRGITRDLKWGVPVPIPEFADKVFYVWFDAPVGYLSITKELLGDDWKLWWKNPKNVELYNFVGKDNVAFHSVMFPASLIGTRDNYTLVNHLCATEYLNYENTKFSKSRGTGVFGDTARDAGIDPDIWRFYLLYMRPEAQDTSFSWDDFALKVNSELLNNLGNFVNRGLSFLVSSFGSIVPEMEFNDIEDELLSGIASDLKEYDSLLSSVKLRDGIGKILMLSRRGNLYMQTMQPWVLIKGDPEQRKRAGTVIGVACNISYLIAVMLHPYMPAVSAEIREQCGLPRLPLLPSSPLIFLPSGHKIGKPKPLFVKMEKSFVEEMKKKYGGSSEKTTNNEKEKMKKVEGKKGNKKNKIQKDIKEKPMVQLPKQNKVMDKFAHHPELAANYCIIDEHLRKAAELFKEKREIFINEQMKIMNEKKKALIAEVESLKAELIKVELAGGIKQVSSNLSNRRPSKSKPVTVFGEENISTHAQQQKVEQSRKEMVETKVKNEKPEQKKDVNKKKSEEPKRKSEEGKKKNDNKAALDDAIDVGRLDMRIGLILKAEKHPDADALYVEQIDLGEEKPRTVVSGLVRHIPIDEMQNRLVLCLCNLKPVKMRGVESQAMVMCASTPEKVEILEVPETCKPGQRVICPGFVDRPDSVLNPKKKIWETVAVDLAVGEDGKAAYKGQPLMIDGQLPVTAPSLRCVPVK